MLEVRRVEEKEKVTFEQFIEKEIAPLVKTYKPHDKREEWYLQWYLIPMEVIDPNAYIIKLLNLRKDPALTAEFKEFLFKLASIVHFDYVRKHH